MKKLILLFFVITLSLQAQVFDAPSGYTERFGTHRLRLWDYDDNPSADSLNQNYIDIADAFVKREFEFLANQIRTTNGALLVGSSADLDTALSSSILKFKDVTNRGEVPFTAGDVIFCRQIAQSGVGYDLNGNIVDSDALIKRYVYQVDSTNGLLVYVSAHSDSTVPSNKGTLTNGDTFVRIANVSNGVDLIEISSDLANSPRITWYKDLNNWSEYLADSNKVVVIGNIGNLVTKNFGTVSANTIGAYFYGGSSGGNVILDGVDINMSNQSSIFIGDFGGDLDDISDGTTYVKMSSGERTKLSGVESGATAGANWNSNLTNIPSTLQTPSGSGLFLSSTNMGYYDGSTWKTYMDNTGNFYLGGTGGSLTWDAGTNTLNITGAIKTSSSGQRIDINPSDKYISLYTSGDVRATIEPNVYNTSYAQLGLFAGAGGRVYLSPDAEVYGNLTVGGNLTVTGSYGLSAGDIPDLSATYSVTSHTHTFASLTSKPTTISGYGITDASWVGSPGSFTVAVGTSDIRCYYRNLNIGGTTLQVITDIEEVP